MATPSSGGMPMPLATSRARCNRTRPGPDITDSVVTRPLTRSRWGQKLSSSLPTGPKSMWQLSLDTGICRPSMVSSAPMPRPVPGPRITRGPSPIAGAASPICFNHSGRNAGSESACASKSLSKRPDSKSNALASFGPSMVQDALVKCARRSITGPATQIIADFGFSFRRPSTVWMADSGSWKSLVCKRSTICGSTLGVAATAKRELVPPISAMRTGCANMKMSPCRNEP